MENRVFLDQLTCRTCLNNVDVSNSLHDCIEHDIKIELKEVLCKVSSISIDWNRTLQLTRICTECTDKLLKAYAFQTQVVANEKRLNEYFEDARKTMMMAQDDYKEDDEQHTASPLGSPLNNAFALEEDNENDLQLKTFKIEDECPIRNDPIEENFTSINIEPVQIEPTHVTSPDTIEITKEEETEENKKSSKRKAKTKEPKVKRGRRPKPRKPRKQARLMEEATFQCETCARKFFSVENLERHKKSHLGSGSYQCTHCARSFTKKDNLLRHMITHKVSEDVPNKHKYKHGLCPHCGESFPAASLIIHIRRHTGETPYKCDICEKGFPRMQDLTLHKRLHTGEKPYVCQTCNKAFSRTNSLARHIRVHTGERPYKCNQCDKSFAQSNDLNMHIRRHTGEKPYKCNVCNMSFINGSILKNHRRAASHFEEDEKGPDRYEKIRVTNPHRACWTTKGDEKKVIGVKDIKDLLPVRGSKERVSSDKDGVQESLAVCKEEELDY